MRATSGTLWVAARRPWADVKTKASEFVAAAQKGDAAALERLVTHLLPRVRNLVRYLVWRDSDVDDLTQEALITVLAGIGSYRGEGVFEAWTDRVVARAVFRRLSRLSKEPARDHASEPWDGAELMTDVARPDEYLVRRRAVALLDRLSPEQRHVLVLHHVLEMTVPEIADELKVPVETVRSRLRLGKQNLRGGDGRSERGEEAK
jgi:RNA polymerase sigma-70 factor (ECF subfamily)